MGLWSSTSTIAICVASWLSVAPPNALGWPETQRPAAVHAYVAPTGLPHQHTPALASDPAYKASYDELVQYLTLEADWDGYGGAVPDHTAIHHAMTLLSAAWDRKLPTPRTMISSSGEVGLYWRLPDAYAELGMAGDGTFYWFIDGKDTQAGADGDSIAVGLPAPLIEFLRPA